MSRSSVQQLTMSFQSVKIYPHMPASTISRGIRDELIGRFNERVKTPSAYLDFPDKKHMVRTIELSYDVNIPEAKVGHAALVLVALNNHMDEALPFALDPVHAVSPREDDFIYGFHKYVAREAVAVTMEMESFLETTLDLWRTDNGGVIALCRGRGYELTKREIEAVRHLSIATPDVLYATTRFEDEAKVKIMGGAVMARACGPNQEWQFQQTPNTAEDVELE